MVANQLKPVFGLLVSAIVIGAVVSGSIKRPSSSECNKLNTYLKVRHIYSYEYTITTSGGFTGTSSQRSGSKLTCKVNLKVPRKCEVVMRLSNCNVQGLDSDTHVYIDVDDRDFVLELESYPLYFQLNEGLIVPNTIIADNKETEAVLNIKRGILSALQFDVGIPEEFDKQQSTKEIQKEKIDLFGSCPTTYIHDKDKPNEFNTIRSIPECQLRHSSISQWPKFGITSLRSISGGVQQNPVQEARNTFDMRIFCKHSLRNLDFLDLSICTQQQFFRPAAFVNEQQTIHSLMFNVTQTLKLDGMIRKGQKEPNRNLNGRRIVDIGFDLGDQSDNIPISDLNKAMDDLKEKFEQNDVENLPEAFDDVVFLMRTSSLSVLHDMMVDVFSCGQDCDDSDVAVKTFYLDGLKSCGTSNCHLQLFECILHEDHMDKFSTSEFLYGLGEVDHVSEAVQLEMLEYCKISGSMRCWLPLGTVLSKTDIPDKKLSSDSPIGKTFAYMKGELMNHCSAEKLEVAPRQLITAIKVLGNIAFKKIRSSLSEAINIHTLYDKCLVNKVIPDSVVYVILQEIQEDHRICGYKDMPEDVVADLLRIFDDDLRHNNLRTLAFSILSKTSDEAVLKQLADRYTNNTDTYNQQLIFYIVNFIHLMYENDQPDLQQGIETVTCSHDAIKRENLISVREAWMKQPRPQYVRGRHRPFNSKPLYFGDFFKIPFSEYFGGVLYMDLIYDPTSVHVSSVSVQLNYYFENTRYNVFEFTFNMHGIDQLYAALNIKPGDAANQFMMLLKGGMGGNRVGEDKFPKFQQDLMQKVMELLNKVNFPKFPDFDVYFDLKRQGQSFSFISLQEVLGMIRGMAHQNPRYQQDFLQRLLQSIEKDAFKVTEFFSMKRVIPTGAGIPLKSMGRLSGWNRIKSSIKSNLLLLMGKKAKDITMGLKQYVLFNNVFHSRAEIPIGNVHTSGVAFKLKLGSERDLQVDVQYRKEENGSKAFHMDYSPITKDKTSETLMYARGRQFLLTNKKWEEIKEDETVQTLYKQCLSDLYQTAVGRSLCATVSYPKVEMSTHHPRFPLSGPFDMELVMEKVDSVDLFSLAVDYTNSEDLLKVLVQHTGQGTTLSRHSTMELSYDKNKKRMEVFAEFAEFGLEYRWVNDFSGGEVELSEFLRMQEEELFGYRLKGTENKGKNSWTTNLKFARPKISWELDVTTPKFYRSSEDRLKVVITYYCSQLRPFLYLLHLSPEHALRNGDKTVLTFEFFKDNTVEDRDHFYQSVEFLDDKLELTYIKEKFTYQLIPKYTNTADGSPRELSGHFTLVKSLDILGGPQITGFVVLNGAAFGLSTIGTLEADMQSFVFTSEIKYQKDVEVGNLSRRKRWINNILGKLETLEEAVVDRFYKIEESIIGKRSVESVIDTSSEQYLSSVTPTFPSIWELPEWTSKLEVKGKLEMVPETEHSQSGIKLVLEESFQHPWNGGFRLIEHTSEFGTGKKNSFRDFRYWANGQLNMTYTNFDGTPSLDVNGKPLKQIRSGEFHMYRRTGKYFDFGVHYTSPDQQIKYEIMFDWDAVSHHEPLVRVVSDYKSSILPYFNHQYEEKFSIETGHWIHYIHFDHKMVGYEVTTDLQYNADGFYMATECTVQQTGTLRFSSSDQDKTFTFTALSSNLKGEGPLDLQYSINIQDSTIPDKEKVYTYYLKERQCGVKVGEKKAPDSDVVTLLWEYRYDLLETMVKVTVTWEPNADKIFMESFQRNALYPGLAMKTYAESFRLPYMRRPMFFTSMSLSNLTTTYVKPNVMKGMIFYNNMMANFVPQDKRKGDKGTLNPRLNMLIKAMKNYKDQEPSPMQLMFGRLNYFTYTGLANLLLMQGAKLQQSPHALEVLNSRKLEYAYTFSFILEYRNGFFYLDWRESDEHAYEGLRIMRRKRDPYVDSNYAVIFKQHEKDAGLNVLTFGGHMHEIPAGEATHGSYLLAADLLQGRYSLVTSPRGITLIGNHGGVTIGFNDDVFIDDSIVPSADTRQEIGDKDIIWQRHGTEIHVETAFGVSMDCDMTWSKVCFIGLGKLYRNTTIGLLGTNNQDVVADRRGVEGHLIKDTQQLVSGFCLDGCMDIPDSPGPSEECQTQGKAVCEAKLRSTKYWYRYYSCRHALGISIDMLKGLQCNTNTGCGMDNNSMCTMIRTMVNLCQREKLLTRYEELVSCEAVTKKDKGNISPGKLVKGLLLIDLK